MCYKSKMRELLWEISVLLGYLGRQSNNRLQAQFEDTRSKLSSHLGQIGVPPETSYGAFNKKLSEASCNLEAGKDLTPDEVSFLEWARDFLAAVAAPATVESIEITRNYTEIRSSQAGGKQKSPGQEPGLKCFNSARWLAKSARRLERLVCAVALVTVSLTIYITVGQLILHDANTALKHLEEANLVIEQHASVAGDVPVPKVQLSSNIAMQICTSELTVQLPSRPVGQALVASAAPALDVPTLPSTAATGTGVQTIASACRQWRWALMRVWSEDARLKSWASPFTHEHLRIRVAHKEGRVLNPIAWFAGWIDSAVQEEGKVIDPTFCHVIQQAYLQHEVSADKSGGCPLLARLLVQDSASVAASIMSVVTNSVLPCLYAFIGAAMAALFSLGRKIDASLVTYTDRSTLSFGAVRGLVFGAIIGVFASYINNKDSTNVLGLSAIALLAGINVPGVFAFLTDLSGRVFGTTSPVKG
ncbi:MAG: hypothetical protein JOY71_11225 [Acetobacteraceae bacterium]|nr:hypothetical protein [Acetobacteraceae bacterium]